MQLPLFLEPHDGGIRFSAKPRAEPLVDLHEGHKGLVVLHEGDLGPKRDDGRGEELLPVAQPRRARLGH